MKKLLPVAALLAISFTGFAQPKMNVGVSKNSKSNHIQKYKQEHKDDIDIKKCDAEIRKVELKYQAQIDNVNRNRRLSVREKNEKTKYIAAARDSELLAIYKRYDTGYYYARH